MSEQNAKFITLANLQRFKDNYDQKLNDKQNAFPVFTATDFDLEPPSSFTMVLNSDDIAEILADIPPMIHILVDGTGLFDFNLAVGAPGEQAIYTSVLSSEGLNLLLGLTFASGQPVACSILMLGGEGPEPSQTHSIITTRDYEDVLSVLAAMENGYQQENPEYDSLWNQRYAGYLKPAQFANIWSHIDGSLINWLSRQCSTEGNGLLLINGQPVHKTGGQYEYKLWASPNNYYIDPETGDIAADYDFLVSVVETEDDTIVTLINCPTSLCVIEIIMAAPIFE